MMVSRSALVRRRWRLAVLIAGCAALGVLVSALVVPQYLANAGATGVSTTWATATNTANGSTAASSDAPGGAKRGTTKPGDTIKWVVDYQNNTANPASVDLRTNLQAAGTYVPGSLQLPPPGSDSGTLAAQFSTNGGQTWSPGSPPSNANGVGATGTVIPTGTARRSANFPAPAAVQITQTGGDVYSLVVRGNLTYGVYHHSTGPVVFCTQQDGSTCPGWPTGSNVQIWSKVIGTPIGAGPEEVGLTPNQVSPWISGNKLFWILGTPTTGTSAGVACLDLSPVTPTSCGLTNLGQLYAANTTNGSQIAGTGLPASNGLLYTVAAGPQGARLICINPSNGVTCGAHTLDAVARSAPQNITSATFGGYIFATTKESGSSGWKIYCFNTVSGADCSGSWPVVAASSGSQGALPFAPILSSSGGVTGVCATPNGEGVPAGCWNLAGAVVANPYAGTGAQHRWGGDAFVVGTKVYLGNNNDYVMCRDFASYSGSGAVPACAGFAVSTNGLIANSLNYTVRDASGIAAGCLVATGDGRRIIYFNAQTGGACTGASSASVTVAPLLSYCGTGSAGFRGWSTLSLPGLVAGKYANSTITLKDQNGSVIPGFNNVVVNPGNSLNLSAISTTVTSITATVVVNGVSVTDPTGVTGGQIVVTWQGDPPQLCFQTVAPPVACDAAGPMVLSIRPVATTTSAGGDGPGGNATGLVEFDNVAAASQCSLLIKKTSPVQTARPGDRVTYAVTVQNTGSQAYNAASFTDDLSDVLKDAIYNNDHAATAGTASYANPVLSWSGGLAASGTATITYSVTVKSQDDGDHSMLNTVVSPTKGSNCGSGSSDPQCRVTVTVSVTDVLWHKVDATAAKNILPGASWTFTPVDAGGRPTGAPIVVDDCVADTAASCTGADRDPLGGAFRITNLGPGTYQLVETRAPVGFRVDPTPIPVTIGAASTTVSLADVVNVQQPVPAIPFTGGVGTDTLTIAAGALFALTLAAIAWQLIRRRRNA